MMNNFILFSTASESSVHPAPSVHPTSGTLRVFWDGSSEIFGSISEPFLPTRR